MTEPSPDPQVSRRVSPLAVIVVVIIVGVLVFALIHHHGHPLIPAATHGSAASAGSSNPGLA